MLADAAVLQEEGMVPAAVVYLSWDEVGVCACVRVCVFFVFSFPTD